MSERDPADTSKEENAFWEGRAESEREMKFLRQQLAERDAEIEQWRKRAEWLGTCYKDRTESGGRIVIVLDGTKAATYPDDADVIAGLIDNVMKDSDGFPDGLKTSKQQIADLTQERDEYLRLLKWAEKFSDGRIKEQTYEYDEDAIRIIELCGEGSETKCQKCGDKLDGHEDESGTHCRWCVTGGEYASGEENLKAS